MARLSLPVEKLKAHYAVVVVGSGYGGGIAASRLARAGQSVCVLERGREFQPGEYPDTLPEILAEAQVDTPALHLGQRTGLYDIRLNQDINVFLGCGLGGTSLVNANVSLKAEPRVFEDTRWPEELRADSGGALEAGYRRAEEMLRPVPYPADYAPLHKMQALERSAGSTNQKFERLPINVTFEDGVNQAGVLQKACTLCGDCVTGCNHGAKNTVLMNYLPDAVGHGAEIFTQVSVRMLERKGGRWLVHYQLLDSGREAFDAPTMFVSADVVVLAAGSLGSTEILLRSKAAGLELSSMVGHRFTGNGDVLAFTYNSEVEIDGIGFGPLSPEGREPVGPCITGVIDVRRQPNLGDGMVIEEGSIPGGLGALIPGGLAAVAPWHGKDLSDGADAFAGERARELQSLLAGPYVGAVKNTQTYLVMSHDDGAGRLVLEGDRLRIRWPQVGRQPVFEKASERLKQVSLPLGGVYLKNPLWSELTKHNLITVHPLGGCVMADAAESGVVNHKGQVFASDTGAVAWDGLYVCDGSVIPRPLGVNPLLTISALAERSCELIAADRGWTIDYHTPPRLPVPAPTQTGIRFTETMKGHFSARVKDDYQAGRAQGERDHSPFEFTLTVISDNLERMLAEPGHSARMVGTATAPALSSHPLTVSDGRFSLFASDEEQVGVREMRYAMTLTSDEGRTYSFDGFKVIRNDGRLDVWGATTTLYITLWEGEREDGVVLGKGVLVIRPEDFLRQLTTMQVTGARDAGERLDSLLRFGFFFAGTLFEVYGGVFARANEFDPAGPVRKRRPLRMGPPELYFFKTDDGVELRLTRYQGGRKGPVVLAPGFGTSTLAFTADTVDTNFPEYLFASGYDTWLFDYRASPELPSSLTQFTLDDIAIRDYPAAVALVRRVSGAESIQAVVHCIGSMTFLMSMLAGLEGVRSAVCSQLAFFPVSPPANEIRAGSYIGNFVAALGLKTVTTDVDRKDWKDVLADAVFRLNPTGPPCNSAVCRRIWLIYGNVYDHAQLNDATHRAIHEMFGVANLATFNHIALMVRKGRIVNGHGDDTYLPNISRLKIPVSFLHGARNGLFLPEGTEKSFRLLCEKNGPRGYTRSVFPDYAHMDCFVGRNASRDVFPEILSLLDAHN